MDREIPKEVRNKERNKKIIRYGGIGVASVIVISVLISFMRTGVKTKDLVFSTVDKGTIEVSVSASGKVVPAFEEIINSPINTRIVEIYKKGGDSVDIGTPILKLDLQSVETDYKKLLDEEQMRSYKLNQLRVNNQTKLNDLAMKKYLQYKNPWKQGYLYPILASIPMGIVAGCICYGLNIFVKSNFICLLVSIPIAAVVYLFTYLIISRPSEDELRRIPGGSYLVRIAEKLPFWQNM